MAGGVGMLGGMAIRRRIAAQRSIAFLTGAQVDPRSSDLHALLALSPARVFNLMNRGDMGTGGRHASERIMPR